MPEERLEERNGLALVGRAARDVTVGAGCRLASIPFVLVAAVVVAREKHPQETARALEVFGIVGGGVAVVLVVLLGWWFVRRRRGVNEKLDADSETGT